MDKRILASLFQTIIILTSAIIVYYGLINSLNIIIPLILLIICIISSIFIVSIFRYNKKIGILVLSSTIILYVLSIILFII